jgi:hypothetical protein
MALQKATTQEQIDRMRRELKAELEQLNKFFAHAADEATAEKKGFKEEKKEKKEEALHETITKMANEIGRSTAIARGAQKNLEDVFYKNKELVDIYKKDATKGKQLLDKHIKNQAKALAMVTGFKAEVLEKQIKASVDMRKAMEESQKPLFAMKRSMMEMAKNMQHNLKKWPVLGRFFTDAMVEHYRGIAKEINHIFSHHMKEILKPVEILLEPFKTMWKIGGILFKFFKDPKPTLTEKRTAVWQNKVDVRLSNLGDILKEATGYAQKSYELQEDEAKRKLRATEGEKKGPMFWIASILGLVAGAIAGLLGGVQLQTMNFLMKKIGGIRAISEGLDDLIKSTVNMFGRMKAKIKGFFTKRFADTIEGLVDLGKAISKRFTWISKAIELVKGMFSSFKGGFLTGFMKGLKWIAWPITLIMTLVDAIKGFAAGFEEGGGGSGGIISGLVGALKEALKGFIYLPVKLFGWVADWVLKQFNMEIEGGAAEGIFKVIDMIFGGLELMFHTIYNGLIGLAAEIVAPFSDSLAEKVRGYRTGKGLNADPEKAKALADRTANANAPEKARAQAEAKTQAQQKEIIDAQSAGGQGTQTFTETVTQMGDKISQSIQSTGKVLAEIPSHGEEQSMGWMSDAMTDVGGA